MFETELLFVESGGDNLAGRSGGVDGRVQTADLEANYSRELADYIIYVIDVSGGDKIPRKGGPGISQSDLLIVNKVSRLPFLRQLFDHGTNVSRSTSHHTSALP